MDQKLPCGTKELVSGWVKLASALQELDESARGNTMWNSMRLDDLRKLLDMLEELRELPSGFAKVPSGPNESSANLDESSELDEPARWNLMRPDDLRMVLGWVEKLLEELRKLPSGTQGDTWNPMRCHVDLDEELPSGCRSNYLSRKLHKTVAHGIGRIHRER